MSTAQALRNQRAEDMAWGIVLAEVAKHKALAQERADRFYMSGDDIVIDVQAQLQTLPRLMAHLKKYVAAIERGPSWAQSVGLRSAPCLRTAVSMTAQVTCLSVRDPRALAKYINEVNVFWWNIDRHDEARRLAEWTPPVTPAPAGFPVGNVISFAATQTESKE